MDIFFSTLGDYTAENEGRKKPETMVTKASTSGYSSEQKFFLLLAVVITDCALLMGDNFVLLIPLIIVIFVFLSKFLSKLNYRNQLSFAEQKWLVLNEEIHFLDNEIQVHVQQDKHIVKCAYKEIANLQLCYQDIRDVYHRKASFFTWNHQTGYYKYYFSLQDGDSKKKLLTLLDFLYKNNIPIQEIDDDENELYMLQIRPKKMKVVEEIQDLIDEIGKDDTKA